MMDQQNYPRERKGKREHKLEKNYHYTYSLIVEVLLLCASFI